MSNQYNDIRSVITDVMKQQESIILDQLSDLVNRGLLVLETTQPLLTSRTDEYGNYKIELNQYCKLKLKDQDYIEKLEKENKILKEYLDKIKEFVSLTFQDKKYD